MTHSVMHLTYPEPILQATNFSNRIIQHVSERLDFRNRKSWKEKGVFQKAIGDSIPKVVVSCKVGTWFGKVMESDYLVNSIGLCGRQIISL